MAVSGVAARLEWGHAPTVEDIPARDHSGEFALFTY